MSTTLTTYGKTRTLASLIFQMPEACKEWLPSGSGFDAGTEIVLSTRTELVLSVDFHHMDEHGFYDGWTSHRVTLTPEFDGIRVVVTGEDRDDIHAYIGDHFHYVLCEQQFESVWHADEKRFSIRPVESVGKVA